MKILNKNPFEDKNLSWIENTGNSSLKVEPENNLIEIINNEFDYKKIDQETGFFLKEKEKEIQEIMVNTYTEIGKILTETQEKLSKSGYGCFLEWTKSLGLKKDKVYSLINRYKLILSVETTKERNLLENIPLSLSYEISKKSVNKDLRAKVLDGEITTLKEFRKYKEKTENKISIPKEDYSHEKLDFKEELEKIILSFGVKKMKTEKIVKELLNNYEIVKK